MLDTKKCTDISRNNYLCTLKYKPKRQTGTRRIMNQHADMQKRKRQKYASKPQIKVRVVWHVDMSACVRPSKSTTRHHDKVRAPLRQVIDGRRGNRTRLSFLCQLFGVLVPGICRCSVFGGFKGHRKDNISVQQTSAPIR